ncbi:GNAT family N-acetyltransferase [Paenibacillus polygoni]|uniref:GNAT family N-acetyltransferase n=1 Tax=Paenibacillus polygoni TaxID=3050112 RepID=A0ABY8X781_9BACL|nr:GNAT family N-acetyltransferase [Paenibacillus polygoni]WIV20326.1 GNAT family N-acetyltransferase [Paenibacillus polygoni]
MNIQLRELCERDPEIISNAFKQQGWEKPLDLYVRYSEEQKRGERVSIVAEVDGDFAGYVNVLWDSYYPSFRERRIPEINDFNVLMKYRRLGIGSKLMDKAEEIIKERSDFAGIGVGLFTDYGNAQILYAKRGYIPDGRGIHNGQEYLEYGDVVAINDDLTLYLTKKLNKREICIKNIIEEQAEQFWRIRLESLRVSPEAFGTSYEDSVGIPISEVVKMIKNEHDEYILGAFTEDDQIVGIAGFKKGRGMKFTHKGMVWGVYVTPDYRGKGIGKSLMEEILNRGKESEELKQINLSVITVNRFAVELYKRLGFESYGIEKNALEYMGEAYDEEHMTYFYK